MKCKILLVMVVLLLSSIICVPSVFAESVETVQPVEPVETVSPDEFAQRVNGLIGAADEAISLTIVRLAMLVFLISALALILGSLFRSAFLSQVGKGGLLLTSAGLLIFYGRDIILGLIQGIPGLFR